MARSAWCNAAFGNALLSRMRRSRFVNSLAAAVLIVPLLGQAAEAASPVRYAAPQVNLGPRGSDPGAAPVHLVQPVDKTGSSFAAQHTSWPGAASASFALTAPGTAPASTTAKARSATGAEATPSASAPARVEPGALGAAASAPGVPVTLRAVAGASGVYQGPGSVGVRVLDHTAAVKAGIPGVMFTATPATSGRGTVQASLNYAGFAQAFGGNYASRLRLVQLPGCALTTPQLAACRTETPLKSTDDTASSSLTAEFTLGQAAAATAKTAGSAAAVAASPMVLAATSSPSSGDGGGAGGQYAATSLKPAGSWTAGGSTGSFDYSYPITVPSAVSALVPTVGLSYDSGSVDGQTASTQAQSDWLGDGWSTPENFIEQSFASCSDDPEGTASPQPTGDECWDGDILTISLNGSSTSLVLDDSTGTWKMQDDGGAVVTQVTGGSNDPGVYKDEYWKVTERDGTSYYFGLNELPGWSSGKPTTNSVQSEPVYSAHQPAAGNSFTDPCYNATWSDSWCTMAYRWNLDYVTDVHGNAMAYYYDQDANAYAQNNDTSSATSYVRDAYLDHIDYGFTDGGAYGTIPDKVVLTTGDRCMAGTSGCDPLDSSTSANWPDVPFDLQCATGSSCQITGPSFYSTVRLAGITTEQYNGTGYNTVDSYTFTQTMPPTGDDTSPTLWLASIGHTGSDTSAGGPAVKLPNVVFTGVQEANRVDTVTDGLPALDRWRIKTVTSETGAVTSVNYELVNPCTAPVTLDPATNTSSCYPVYWTPSGATAPLLDWFNKYVVSSVDTSDPTGGSPGLSTSYKYLNGAAWHYDDNELVKSKYRTYGQYRGYGDVQIFTGQSADPQTEQETTYYRGMSDDNNTTAVTLTDSQGGTHDDTDQLAGEILESTDYYYSGGPIADSTINSFWVSAASASRARTGLPALTANATGQVETWTRTAITDQSPTSWRTTESDTTFDTNPADPDFGLPTITYAHGDLSASGNSQKRCTSTTYAPANTTKNIVGLVAEVEVDADPCGGTNPNGVSAPTSAEINALTAPTSVNRPGDVVSDERTFYDLQPLGSTTRPTTSPAWPQAAPAYGDKSETQTATGYTNGAFTYEAASEATFDSYGLALDAWDALGRESQNSYTMSNGLVVGQAATNPAGQSTTAVLDPERAIVTSSTDPNGVVTQNHADGLGRKIAIWLNSRPTTAPADYLYTYSISNSAPSVTTTQTLNNESGYATSEAFFDALLRPRQTQSPTPQGGRLITDTFYDTHGWSVKVDSDYWDTSSTPDTTMAPVVADNKEYQQTLTSYDGLGQAVETQSLDNTASPVVDQIAYSEYTGDQAITVPPAGGTAQATLTDALGRTTALLQYTSAPTVTAGTAGGFASVSITGGSTQATDYVFNNVGQQTDVKDATSGEDWNSSYNMLGQVTGKDDPDAGASTMAYDPAGQLTQTTDSLGKTISYTYDALGRKTAEYDAASSAQSSSNEIASWAYDNSNNAVAGMTDPIGQLTTETEYNVDGGTYTVQQKGFNVFGDSTGETITVPTGAGAFSSTNTFTYSSGYGATTGIPTSTTFPAAGAITAAETVQTGYTTSNGIDLPSTLASAADYVKNTTYTAFGQVGSEELGNTTANAQVTNTYNWHTGALTDSNIVNTAVSATPIDDTSYTYDQAGNPTSQTETRQGTASEIQCFQYDPLDRLTQAWTATDKCAATPTTTNDSTVGDGIANGAYWTSWTYDSLGQWLSQDQHSMAAGTADTTTAYTYGGTASGCSAAGGTNTLQSAATTSPSGNSTSTYCYDAEGDTTQRNTASNGQQSLTWNDQGELSAVTTASSGSSYVYDPEGNLLVEKDAATNTSILYLPGQQLSLNTGSGQVSATRFYALPGGGQVVRTGLGTNYDFQLSDTHGTSLLQLSSTLTSPVWRQQTPFGAARGTTVTWDDNLGFLNKPQDPTTGLTDIGARWYDPSIGRFTSLDPEFEPDQPQQQNGYTYSADNPITGSDPTGLRWQPPVGGCNGPCPLPEFLTHPAPLTQAQKQMIAQSDARSALAAALAQAQAKLSALKQRVAALDAQIEADEAKMNSDQCSSIPFVGGICAELKSWEGGITDAENDALNLLTKAGPTIFALIEAIGGCTAGLEDGDCGPSVQTSLNILAGVPDDNLSSLESDLGMASAAAKEADLATGLSEADSALQDAEGAITAEQKEVSDLQGCLNSFKGTTPVVMADGTTKAISKVKVGDKVSNNLPGADPGTKNQTHTVTAIHVTYTDTDFTNVTINTPDGPATITGTAHHPYWDQTTRAWTDADQLRPGDRVETSNADLALVLATHDFTSHSIVTYNLTVDGLHTYYVVAGDTPVLVHNAPLPCYAKGVAGELRGVQELQDKGYTIIGTQISVKTAAANVRIDIVAERNGQTYFFDVKNGPYAGFTKNQGRLGGYNAISMSGGTYYGKNAANAQLSGSFPARDVYVIQY